jgi:hypothetical protein
MDVTTGGSEYKEHYFHDPYRHGSHHWKVVNVRNII